MKLILSLLLAVAASSMLGIAAASMLATTLFLLPDLYCWENENETDTNPFETNSKRA